MWTEFLNILLRVGMAFVLALPLGWEREVAARSAGLRTFPLVALGACAYLLIGQHALGDSAEAQARILSGLLTGIGFIGGGAILKGEKDVRGIATAASLWNTGAIGAAAAYGRYELGLMLSLGNLLTLHLLRRALHRRQAPPPR
ncbi:MgtC/SapB family protein [Archangium minus]|uniref:MgtC/SapB family protein n=1 Tax=Archangium minus TaxID=83450 RepID=A0ABY9WQA1_9BACT|nr:MgtC/SapB family protein [Archangium violaceum]WNG44640.1 MgtC/SapB family protein [Archangium minus]